MNEKRIYLSPPHMSGLELEYVRDAFESNWIAPLGPHVDAFEQEFAVYHGVKRAVAVSTGTAALHLALRILGIDKGDEVYCSTFTFCASATPIVYERAQPVFIDSEPASWNIDPNLLKAELKRGAERGCLPKALIVVHLYGQSADMDPILNICKTYDVPVIEDAAEALGAKYKGKPCGTLGMTGIFSFNGNKIITTSSGGMIVSQDEAMIARARHLATQARDRAPHYQHSEIGYNYRMSNILAAIGRGQLEALPERIEQSRAIFDYYQKRLGVLPGIDFMPEPDWSRSNRWLSCIIVDPEKSGLNREDIRIHLDNHNIESRPLWKPMHLQPVFSDYRIVGGSVSEKLFEYGLCLPSGTALEEKELDFICSLVEELHHSNKTGLAGISPTK